MATPIGDVVVRIGADLTELQKGVQKAQGHLGRLGKEFRSGINIAAKYSAAMAAAGAALSVTLVGAAGDAAREIRNLSKVAGTSTDVFQRAAYGAKQFGIEQEKLSDIFKDVQDKVGDFLNAGGGPLADFFERIAPQVGITAESFRNLSGPQALQKYVGALEKANLSQSEMTFFMEAIASDATALLPLLKNNSAELNRLGAEAAEVGAVLSDIEIDSLVEAKKSMDRLQESMAGLSNMAAVSLGPAIRAIADVLSRDLNASLKSSKADIADWGDVVGDVLAFSADATRGALKVIGAGFTSAGETIGGAVAQGVAMATGQFDEANRIAEDWRGRQAEIWSSLANDTNLTEFRDRLAEVREEIQRMAGISEIELRVGKRQSDPALAKVVKAAEEAAAKELSIRTELAAATEEQRLGSLTRQLEMLRENLMSETELESARYQERFETLQENLEAELITEGEYQKLREEMELQHQARMTEIEREGLTERQKFEQLSMRQKTKSMLSELTNITAGVSQTNRKLFEVNKAAAMAEAAVALPSAIMKTWNNNGGYPWAIPATIAMGAAGLAQINAIRSASFGGGAAPSIAGSTPATPVSPVSSGAAPGGPSQRIAIEGLDPGQMFSGRQIRELLERLEDQVNDGATLTFV
jgi:hypothetical protein